MMQNKRLNMSISHGEAITASVFTSQTLPEMLDRAASSTTGIIFIDGDNSEIFQSYSDLLSESSSILKGLRDYGLQAQARVILQLNNSRYFFACLWACWLGGFVPVPLGVDLSLNENLTSSKLYRAWELCDRPLVITDIIETNEDSRLETVRVEDLLNNHCDRDYHHANLDDLALLLFTSGSTGKPKGVMLSARNLIASVYGMARVNKLSQQDITLNWMPLEHVASLVMFHLTEVYLQCQQIQVKSELILQNPLQWLNLIHRYRVTATWSPNFAYNLVNEKLAKTTKHNWDLSCLRWMGNGAEAVVGKTTGRFLELLAPYGLSTSVVSPGYGMSETTSGIAHSNDFYLNMSRELVSVGEPIPGISLRIVDEENRVVPEGKIGLLQVKGETVTAGYFKQPELNEKIFTSDGWFNTGDLGSLESGRLTITGRQKDTIIINGVNYYNHDIETVVESISGVNLSYTAACGVIDRHQQEQIAVFFNTEAEGEELRELINSIRKSIFSQIGVSPAYIIPVERETIPKTAIGKIMRSQLALRFNAGEFNHLVAEIEDLFDRRNLSQSELPGNAIEQQLVAVWQEVLKLDKVGVKDNFFELGGNSLLLMQVLSKLTSQYDLSAVTLFQYPTIAALASYLSSDEESVALQQGKRRGELRRQAGNRDVAIIGMSCRFPGANNINEFWDNLCNGVESISFFEDREIIDSGVDAKLVNHPNYVKASPILDNIEDFDADFWGFSPKEAQLLDPQQRLFLECAWESLEDAGYDPFNYQGDISLYGGAATNTYLLNNIYPNRQGIDEQDSLQVLNLSSMGGFQVSTANDKDYLTTRTSYKLNLTGSSVNVQTACSTSLVTVHLACQSLINSECDMALAGGVSVHSPQKMGYLYQEGMILSPDGHCRAFDANASGTIFGSGAGMVVLKLLDKAVEDGDRIYGIIKGSAVNNDGGTKVGYLAPNVDGQTRVISEALAVADISPDTIGYVEAHGTGTKLGDPIEVKALSQAYHDYIPKTGCCAMGSVKTNVGHLQMASGIVGLIKTTLCLYHRKIPASLHFNRPNSQIDFDNSPFYINTQLQDWAVNNHLRRAGVNSLGIGGTNAHVILEEFVSPRKRSDKLLPAYLFTLSAKNKTALQKLATSYQNYIQTHQEASLRDICLTSNAGRHHFDCRYGVVVSNKQELIKKLSNISTNTVQQNNKLAFLFTGQGSQYVGMAKQLYNTCDVFQENCDRCFAILQPNFAISLKKIIFDSEVTDNNRLPASPTSLINQTQYAQPILFIIEYSLAQLWQSWGIVPDVMVGHSIGEYVAATIAEVFSLEAALKLICARGKLMETLPSSGRMLAVFASEDKIDYLLDRKISIAAKNGTHIVLSGNQKDIDNIAKQLKASKIKTQLLNVDRAFHSWLMQPIAAEFATVAKTIDYSIPKIPIVSNLTGELATDYIATPNYWIEHILQPVQFAKSIDYLDKQQVNIFLEIGSKPILTTLARSILDNKLCLYSIDRDGLDWQNILKSLAQLYTAGLNINWQAVTQNYHGNKISLPTYPFQRQRYWFDIPQENKVNSTTLNNTLVNHLHPLIGKPLSSPLKQKIFQSYLNINTHPWLSDHCLENKIIFPGAGYIEIAIALGIFHTKTNQLLIENLEITSPLYINNETKNNLELQIVTSPQEDTWHWEVYSASNDDWILHASGQVALLNTSVEAESLSKIKTSLKNNRIDVRQHYLSCQQKEINYGKSFQGIQQLWAQDDRALGFIELPPHLDSQEYHFHPALLDSCLQILFAALSKELQTNTYIPIGLERLQVHSIPNTRTWSYLELKPASNEKTLIADVWLYNDDGGLIAKIEGLKSQAIKSQPLKSQLAWHNWLYQPEWKPQPLLTQSSLSNTGTWLIFADSQGIGKQLATKLEFQQQKYHLVIHDKIEDRPQAFIDLIQQYSLLTGVIYLWSLNRTEENWSQCQSYLYLIQALIKYAGNPYLWFVTSNAQPVNNFQSIQLETIKNSCLWGMQKAIALEHPELRCVGIDIDCLDNIADNIFQEICAAENEQVAYRDNRRYVNRLVRYSKEQGTRSEERGNLQLYVDNPGNLDSLEWKPVTRQQPQDDEIEIEVKATGLNFRDVMVALDLYPDETKFLGLECAGVVTQVGSQVDNFQVGDEVVAICDRSFSKYLTVNSFLAISKPQCLSFEAIATIPVTFLTAYYTLVYLAKLQPGEKILIHSAAGGVGLAAIQIAQNIGAEIYATASTPKWELLKSMGVTKMMNSRSLDFAEQIKSATDGIGVDVVLNSLSGEFIAKSIAVLNKNSRFVEIGKQGIWTQEDVAKVKPSINYFIVDLWQITQDKPALIQQMLSELRSQFTNKILKPLPYTTFPSDQAIDAFRYMQQGKHQGKIIITPSPNHLVTSSLRHFSGTYLIAGGMGAIGLQVAQWLITKGVNSIVLVGRNDIKPKYQDILEKLPEKAQVICIKADISNTKQLDRALHRIKLTLPTLRGIIHCAGVTSDRTIVQQDWDSFTKVLAAKTQGAWNLHYLTQEYELENFIMFSSAASLIGSAGQTNYCAANAFLDALAHARRNMGLPAISINWGAWSNTGMATNSQITESLKQKGIGSIKPTEGMEILEQLLLDNPAQIGVIPIDWDLWQQNNLVTPYYEDLEDVAAVKDVSDNLLNTTSNYKQQLFNAIPEQRRSLLIEQISQQVANILGIKDLNDIDLELGFSELGLDSLGSVELRNKLQSSYDLKLSQTIVFDYPSIQQLGKHLLSLVFDESSNKETQNNNDLDELENLSEKAAEKLLLEELESFDFKS